MGIFDKIFGKRNPAAALSLGCLEVDMHSHVIPGIDDGAAAMEDSLDMLRAFCGLGYRKIITTPHIMSDGYRNSPGNILPGLEKVREAAKQAGIEIEIEAAAEYYLDEVFMANLDKGVLSFGGDKKYVLFETSYVSKPMSLFNAVFKMQTLGYSPVLAHPERYQYWWERKEAIEEMQEMRERGAKLQVNISSFGGRYGKSSSTIARQLAKENMIDLLGTDMHKARQAETLQTTLKESKELRILLERGGLLNNTL